MSAPGGSGAFGAVGARMLPGEKALQTRLGYVFRAPALLREALTHPSYTSDTGGANNQRLEFLGDAVLQMCVSHVLYVRYAELAEGELTRKRAALVRERSLCEAARALGLGECLRLSPGEERMGGRRKPSILADAMEAVLAAVYLDGGFDVAEQLVERMLERMDAAPEEVRDYKSALQERLQKHGAPTPQYRALGESGPPHARTFRAQAVWKGKVLGEGEGGSKQQAEQQAARIALETLERRGHVD